MGDFSEQSQEREFWQQVEREKNIEAIVAKMPQPENPYAEKVVGPYDDEPIEYKMGSDGLIFEEGSDTRARLLAEKGWIPFPQTEKGILELLDSIEWHTSNLTTAKMLHRWLATGEEPK